MPQEVRVGDTGADVRLLQQMLRDLNYYADRVDGDFGPNTEAALIQYQHDYSLDAVEPGVCGDATWTSLASVFGPLDGLRSEESTDEYVSHAYGIANSSMTAEDRIALLEEEANRELTAAGVPYVGFVLDPATPPYALFDFEDWVAKVEPTPFQPANAEQLPADEQATIAAAVYHEARHAEQWFTIARLLAGLYGLDGATINAQTGIRRDVADYAAGYPILECTMENGPAFDWYENVYGSGAANRNAVLSSLNDADPTNDRFTEYRTGQAEEGDSFDADGSVQREWREYANGGGTQARQTLRRGIYNSEEVRYLQQLLAYHGYPAGNADGDFGADTEGAVRVFQTAHGLDDDGVVGPRTWDALLP